MNDVTRSSMQQLSVDATERLLDNLANSEFAIHYGTHGIAELRCYGALIAGDIYAIFAGEPASQNQRDEFARAFPVA